MSAICFLDLSPTHVVRNIRHQHRCHRYFYPFLATINLLNNSIVQVENANLCVKLTKHQMSKRCNNRNQQAKSSTEHQMFMFCHHDIDHECHCITMNSTIGKTLLESISSSLPAYFRPLPVWFRAFYGPVSAHHRNRT